MARDELVAAGPAATSRPPADHGAATPSVSPPGTKSVAERMRGWRRLALGVLLTAPVGCSLEPQWRPSSPDTYLSADELSSLYLGMLNQVADSADTAGLVWETGALTPQLAEKFGRCSWSLSRTGTRAESGTSWQSLQDPVNAALVGNGFPEARSIGREFADPLLVSQDERGAVFELSLGQPATISISFPAAGAPTCPME